jgi:hypothetical protein
VQPDAGLHKGGSTSSSTLRIRVIGRKPTLDDMNEYLHCKDGIWDTVRAEKASEFFLKKFYRSIIIINWIFCMI